VWGAVVGTLHGAVAGALVLVAAEEPVGGDVLHVGGAAFLGLLVAIGGVLAIRFARSRPGAELRWDERGIEECVGGKPHVQIPWSAARIGLVRSVLTYRRNGVQTGRDEGRTLQITDGRNGATITICDGVEHPDFVQNRPCHVAALPAELIARAEPIPIVPDALGFGRAGRWGFGITALLAYAAWIFAGLGTMRAGTSGDIPEVVFPLFAGSFFFGIRTIWPLTKLGGRGTTAALVEGGLRACVVLFFAAMGAYFLISRSE
jgi:hypothetical protein